MSVNKYRPHVMVLPEDDANRELANGFLLHESVALRAIQVLVEAGGWSKVRSLFEEEHIAEMKKNTLRHMVLLVDFDGDSSRLDEMRKAIPASLVERVFVIGVWLEPEELKRKKLGSFESIGRQLASECHENTRVIWNHELLRHNEQELGRMTAALRPILFPSS